MSTPNLDETRTKKNFANFECLPKKQDFYRLGSKLKFQLPLAVTSGLLALMAALFLLNGGGSRLSVVYAQEPLLGVVHVATIGDDDDDPGCGVITAPCRSVQQGVDRVHTGGQILVAGGIYTGVSQRAGITQVVYLDKSVTIQGG